MGPEQPWKPLGAPSQARCNWHRSTGCICSQFRSKDTRQTPTNPQTIDIDSRTLRFSHHLPCLALLKPCDPTPNQALSLSSAPLAGFEPLIIMSSRKLSRSPANRTRRRLADRVSVAQDGFPVANDGRPHLSQAVYSQRPSRQDHRGRARRHPEGERGDSS